MIAVEHVSKKYGDFLAVDDLTFTIEDGQIYGFLGPNGAGKSTTLNIMTGCLAATSGHVRIDGLDIYEREKEAKKRIGYLPEIPPLYVDQTPREYLEFVAQAKGLAKEERERQITQVMEETHIEEMADRLIRHLSKGYRQRVGIAQALLGNPTVIILDEPTVGLDPAQILEIRQLIRELGKRHTVIFSSHILSEVQAICQKVLILYKGKLAAFDEPESLSRSLSAGSGIAILSRAGAEEIETIVQQLPAISKVEWKDGEEAKSTEAPAGRKDLPAGTLEAVLYTDAEEIYPVCEDIFRAFAAAGRPLLKLQPLSAKLEDIFMELTEKEEEEK